MRLRFAVYFLAASCLVSLLACSKQPEQPATETSQTSSAPPQGPLERMVAKPLVVPAGTVLTVRMGQAVGSKISHAGDSFTATVAEPVEVGGKAAIPAGATASGTVAEAAPRGRFKGGALLRLTLDSVTVNGTSHSIQTAAFSRALKGKGKRTATMIGGGAGLGALIGGLAGGGKGAAIGAIAGAGAGTAGSAFTGNQEIVIPAESAVGFKLLQPLEVKP